MRLPANHGNNDGLKALRTTALPAIAAVALAAVLGGCVTRQQASQPTIDPAHAAAAERERALDERRDEVMKQLAICESGGYGPSDKPIYGGRGLYLGRFQFATRTVMAYVQKRDGTGINPKQAAELAHDYERASDLAKYMIFDLEEPWHWPLCSRKIGMPAQVAAIKRDFGPSSSSPVQAISAPASVQAISAPPSVQAIRVGSGR